jgi:pimeloyl-ACP methyl ester carboxylesterase
MRVSLRPVEREDLPRIDRWAADISASVSMSRTRPLGAGAERHDPAGGLFWYVIVEDDREVGTVWIERLPGESAARLGIFLGSLLDCGRGIGRAALPLAIGQFRAACPHQSIALHVRLANQRAVRCYRSVGFQIAGSGTKLSAVGDQIDFFCMVWSPPQGSISEKTWVDINGVRQGMVIMGREVTNPVLLYLHGGMPDYFLTQDYPTGLDEHFTVVWWDQRGSGLSYHADMPPQTMTAGQLVADTLAVTRYLCERFGRDKIYLMGHSGGTFIGIQAAAQAPELYHAYVGVAQMSWQLKSEQLAYEYMLGRFRERRDARMVRKLERAPVTDELPLPRAYSSVRDMAMHRLGIGTMHQMKSIVSGLMLRSLRFRGYTLREKVGLWRGKLYSGRYLWNEELGTDLATRVTKVGVPMYFLHGVFDYTVSYPLAQSYFRQLEAPLKGFYTFEKSAHSPLFEEPQRMCEILRKDVLGATNALVDEASPKP